MADDPKKTGSDPQGAPKTPFSPQDALEFMQRMWNPLGIAMPGFAAPAAAAPPPGAAPAQGTAQPAMPFPMPAAMFAVLDPAEIDRKIAELRIIENWLAMSMSMMQMSIKTMELQKASLEAMRGGGPKR